MSCDLLQFHHEKSVKSGDQIGSSDWLESTTYRILHYMLTCSDNVYKVTQLLKILDSGSITLIFSKEGKWPIQAHDADYKSLIVVRYRS